MARFDGIRYGERAEGKDYNDIITNSRSQGLGTEVKRRMLVGTYALSAGYEDQYYKKAVGVRSLIRKDFDQVFDRVDVLLTPTTPDVAFVAGEKSENPIDMYMEDIFIAPASLAGIPAISIPAGFSAENLPIGVQFIGDFGKDAELLNIVKVYEQSLE